MKALRWHGRRDLRYEDVPEPSPGLGEVKLKVLWASICGSDVQEYESGPIFLSVEPNPLTGRQAPLTIGHEFSAQVVELGPGVDSLRVGDRVVGECIYSCGGCFFCNTGVPYMCQKVAHLGFHTDGAFAEYFTAPAKALYLVPDTISDEIAAVTEPLAVGVHSVLRSRLKIGDSAVVVGAGAIGISTILAARAAGASHVYALTRSQKRAEKALKFGASAVINPNKEDAVARIRELTGGRGADASFDCAGAKVTGPLAIELARNQGSVVIVGMSPEPSPDFNFISIATTEKVITGAIAYYGERATVLDLIADGRLNPAGFISKKIALKNAVRDGFEELLKNPADYLRIIVKPGA